MNEDNLALTASSYSNFKDKYLEIYISQDNYKEKMINIVEPYLKKNLESGYILGANDLKLYYEKFIVKKPKANIVICHGFGEFTEKYNELIYYFIKENYSVFILEHRGHGRSQRLGMDNYQINVENFDYYVEDFKKFIDEIVIPDSRNKKLLLFAHSMGGCIGTVFLEKYNSYFNAAVLSSPMHEINTGKAPKILANIISKAMRVCGKGNSYLPGQKPYAEKKDFYSRSTGCKERYQYLLEKIKKNDNYHSGGSSALWYIESLKATKELIRRKNISKIMVPILLFQAEYDTHVIPKAQNRFAHYAKDCKVVHMKGSKHESYFERDEIAFSFFYRMLSFYENSV